MIAICFDLSSVCIGVTFARFQNNELNYLQTLAIIPNKPTGIDFGYTTKSPKRIEKNGNVFQGFLFPDEPNISKAEATKRASEFKHLTHRKLLNDIGRQCGKMLNTIQPDIIAIEKNKSFNGILTTKLLAEIAGGLYFYAGATNTQMFDYDEATVRSNIRKTITTFNRYENSNGEMSIDTKWEIYCRLRSYFETHYPGLLSFENITMDESDSLAVFYHWFTTQLNTKELASLKGR